MATVMTMNLNTEESRIGIFHRIPRCLYHKGYTPSTVILFGKIFSSRSRAEQGAEEKRCRLSYEQARVELDVTAPTLSNAFRALKEAGEIKVVNRDKQGAAYSCIEEYKDEEYDVHPEYLVKATFLIEGKMRKLTNAERRVLSHIMTLAEYRKNAGAVEGSARRFARDLNLSEKTVRKAIHTLLKAGLIFRHNGEKGVNSHKLSVYRPHEELYNYKKAQKKPRKAKTSHLPAAVQDATAMAERQRFYDFLREDNQRRADKYIRLAQTNLRYRQVEQDIRGLQPKMARASIEGSPLYAELEEQEKRLLCEKVKLLASMNISPEWLEPTYYCRCKKCNDTGFLPNGRGCDCYQRE